MQRVVMSADNLQKLIVRILRQELAHTDVPIETREQIADNIVQVAINEEN